MAIWSQLTSSKSQINLGGVSVTCQDVSYTVRTTGKQREVLKNVNSIFHPGRLAALMGPSGAGKTTLLDILAGRKGRKGEVSGKVLYADAVLPKSSLKHICGYVEQASSLIPEFTVLQMLQYTAEMKLPPAISYQDKLKHVEKLIEKLQLDSCRETKIGDALHRGISGGQEKRVNVGLALISHPSILLLDEPTSGLDSQMATELCGVLKTLAEEGFTLIATVHSPSPSAFACFDDLLILADGSEAYAGEVRHVKAYFDQLGCIMPQHPYGFSLPDWLLEVVSSRTDICATWKKVDQEHMQEIRHQGSSFTEITKCSDSVISASDGRPSQLTAFRVMLRYRTGARYCDPHFLGARFGDKLALAVVFASLYWKIGDRTDLASVQSTCGIFFFFVAMCGFSVTGFLPALVMERALFYRERADGLYTSLTYYAVKLIEEALMSIVVILLFSAALYLALGLAGSFWIFAMTLYITNFLGIVIAYAIAAMAPNMEIANATLPAYLASAACVCGFFILCEDMAFPWQCYSAISFMKYSWALLMMNHFRAHPAGDSLYYYKHGGLVDVLEFYGLDEGMISSIPACFLTLVALWMAFVLAGILGLTFISHVRR